MRTERAGGQLDLCGSPQVRWGVNERDFSNRLSLEATRVASRNTCCYKPATLHAAEHVTSAGDSLLLAVCRLA